MINCIKVPNDDPRHKDTKQADPNEFVMGAHSINSIRVCYHNSESLLSRFFELKDNLMRRKVLSTEAQPKPNPTKFGTDGLTPAVSTHLQCRRGEALWHCVTERTGC